MTEQDLFRQKAEDGYLVCFAAQCPMKEHCLRWKVGQQMPDTMMIYRGVNPRYEDVATDHCPYYRNAERMRMAKGMTKIFNSDMPKRVEPYVRSALIVKYCRTYYFEFRKGKRLIPPAMQEEIRQLFREAGWNEEVDFDGYVEEYDW